MKARFIKKVGLGLVLSALPFVGACTQQTSNAPQSLITAAQAEPLVATATNEVTPAGDLAENAAPESAPPPPETAPLPAPAPGTGKTFPPNIAPSSPLGEVVKLAQSGVDESVMLSFVTNAAATFSLTSDEIIYLNDIGVADSVVTAMIQRDQALKQSWADTTQAQNAAALAAPAAAPTYVNPPPAEAQPAEAAPTQPANVTYNYFYDSLSPYGTWIDIEGYGYCWQPTVVVINRGWRPYCDRGRWLYSDAGWYWHSYYTWGWAPFHYGRWFCHSRWGWCWYPGYVWGPSWVTWRYSGDYCGWAPLPPAAYYQPGFGFYYQGHSVGIGFSFGLGASYYTFVPWGRFCDRRPWHHRAPTAHVTQIYNNSTVINNVVTGDNNTIINRGVPIDHARRHAGSGIRQVAIREVSDAPRHASRGERLERDGRTLVVHRPHISQSPRDNAAPPRRTHDSQAGHLPVRGAGAAALLEGTRAQSRERAGVDARDRGTRQQSVTPPTVTSTKPTESRTTVQPRPAVSGSSRATPPQVNPSPGASRVTPRSRDERPDTPSRDRNRQNNHSAIASPLVVQGGRQVTPTPRAPATQSSPVVNASTAQKPPAGSLIVIGRRDSNSGQNRIADNDRRAAPARSTHTWSAGQPAAASQPSAAAPRVEPPRVSSPSPATSFSYNRSVTQTPRIERRVIPRSSPAPSFSPPTYSAPRSSPSPSFTPAPSRAPSFSVPRSTPAPSYSAPRSSPRPSYTPAPTRAPSYSAPRSSPSPSRSSTRPEDRSGSGQHGAPRRN